MRKITFIILMALVFAVSCNKTETEEVVQEETDGAAVSQLEDELIFDGKQSEDAGISFDEEVQRLSWSSLEEGSIELSKLAYPDGADYLVLAFGEDPYEDLAATNLALAKDGPILMVEDGLTDDLQGEIDRLDPEEIVIVGESSEFSQGIEEELGARRISGESSGDFSVKLAEEIGADKLIFANREDTEILLPLSLYAANNDMALVLIDGDELANEISDYIVENEIDHVEIAGGEDAVSKDIEEVLGEAFVTRLEGEDASDASVAIGKETLPGAKSFVISNPADVGEIMLALPLANKLQAPVLFTDSLYLNPAVEEYVGCTTIKQVLIIGDEDSVGEEVKSSIDDLMGGGCRAY